MTGIAAVLAWPLDGLAAAAGTYAVAGETTANAASSLSRSFDLDPTWTGRARDGAQARVTAESTRLHRLEGTLLDIGSTVRDGQARMASIRDRLRGQVESARSQGFTVDDDGGVAHPSPKRRADEDYLMDRIRGILDEADAADSKLSLKLKYLMRQLDRSDTLVPLPTGGYDLAGDAAKALKGMSVDDVARYWETLDPAQRDSLIEANPDVIGNLDGVDFADRIRANGLAIQAALAAEVAASRGDGDRAELLRGLLKPAPDPQDPTQQAPRTFLGFHAENGRYIELVGEIRADSPGLGILVPGTGSGPHSAGSYRERAARLAKASGAPVIVYADGTFPQNLALAVDPRPARDIAPRLVEFAAGVDRQLDAAGIELPTTVIGHSYGGTVVGTAEQLGLRADRVVYASSAGTGVGGGPWQNANPQVERYSMTPPGDPIEYWQQLGGHGGDPDVAAGVTRLDTGFYDEDHRLVAGMDAHAGYLDHDSDALRNMAAVISGGETVPYVDRIPNDGVRDALGDMNDFVSDWLSKGLDLVTGR